MKDGLVADDGLGGGWCSNRRGTDAERDVRNGRRWNDVLPTSSSFIPRRASYGALCGSLALDAIL
jgi:hypothetical protein